MQYGGGYSYFNTTWSDTNDTNAFHMAFWEDNRSGGFINYSAERLLGNLTHYNLTYGTGAYAGRFCVNDSANNFNCTLYFNWSIALNSTLQNYINLTVDSVEANKTIYYPDAINVSANRSNSLMPDAPSFTLYRNFSSYGTSNPITDNEILGGGVWIFEYNTSGNANYSLALKSYNVTVNRGNLNISFWLNNSDSNRTYSQNDDANFTAQANSSDASVTNIYIDSNYPDWKTTSNSSYVIYNFTKLLQAGIWNFTAWFAGNTNFTANSSTHYAIVTAVDNPPIWSTNITNPSSPVTYVPRATYQFNITWTDGVSVSYVVFEFNGINYTDWLREGSVYVRNFSDLGVGTYAYRWYANDSLGQWNQTSQLNYVINQNTSTLNFLNLTINNTESDKTYIYKSPGNATGWYDSNTVYGAISFNLSRNGTLIGSANPISEVATFGVGAFNYTYNTTGNANWSSAQKSFMLRINQFNSTGLLKLWLNSTNGNKTYTQNNIANISADLYLNDTVTMHIDSNYPGFTSISNASTFAIYNLTNLSTTGTFNFTGWWEGNTNISSAQQTWYAIVQGRYIETDLIEPTGTKLVQEGNNFTVNATITCRTLNCGLINATPRFDGVVIPETTGTLYVSAGEQRKTCTLNVNETCAVSWTVVTTTVGSFDIDVNASDTVSNETSDATLSVFRVVVQIVSGGGGSLQIVTEPDQPLLDLEIVNFTPRVNAGEKLLFTINLTNVGGQRTFDAIIHKRIKRGDSILVEKVETRSMTSSLLLTDSMDIPKDFDASRYFFELYVEYVGQTASALVTFDVERSCLILKDADYSLFRRSQVLYADSLQNVKLNFENICSRELRGVVMYIGGDKIDIGTVREGYEISVDFEKYGPYNILIEYDKGKSFVDFYLDSRASWLIFVVIIIVLGVATYIYKKHYTKKEIIERVQKIKVIPDQFKSGEVKINLQEFKKKLEAKIKEKLEKEDEEEGSDENE